MYGEKETLLHCWWECKLVQPLSKTVWRFLKKIKTELPYDLTFSFLDIYLKKRKTLIQKSTCTLVFMAALFTVAKIWKQCRFPSADKWTKKMYICTYAHTHTHTMEYYSVIKKWNFVIPSTMGGPGGHYAKWNKSDRGRQLLNITEK